jgi:hypothetical protein
MLAEDHTYVRLIIAEGLVLKARALLMPQEKVNPNRQTMVFVWLNGQMSVIYT